MKTFGIKYEDQVFDIIHRKYNCEKESFNSIKLNDISGIDFSSIKWEPDVLLQHNDCFFIFNYVIGYLPTDFLIAELKKVINKIQNVKCYFVIDNKGLLDDLNELCIKENMGIIFIDNDKARHLLGSYLENDVNSLLAQYTNNPQDYKIPKYILEKLVNLRNINASYIRILKEFAISYMELNPKSAMEDTLIDKVVNELLQDAIIGSAKVLYDNLKFFENFMSKKIRDHYFHSFQVFLLGIIIIDQHYAQFKRYFSSGFNNREDLDIELVWLLTAVFHDVGYILQKLPEMAKEMVEAEAVEISVDLSKDMRFEKNLSKYISLFRNLLTLESGDWLGEGFDEGILRDIIVNVCKEGHGLYSCFLFLIKTSEAVNSLKEEEEKRFLNMHLFSAAIAISLHDGRYREAIKTSLSKNIKMKAFPFAVLLMYLDSLQEDRRNDQSKSSYEDTIKDIKFKDREVSIELNVEYILTSRKYAKMKVECIGIDEFVEYEDIKLQYPKWLIDGN